MTDIFYAIIFATFVMLIYKMYKIDKDRRNKEKSFEDDERRDKRDRMHGFGGKDFWKDPENEDKKKDNK